MRFQKVSVSTILLVIVMIMLPACSNSSVGLDSPVDTDVLPSELSFSLETDNISVRSSIAMYDIAIDSVAETFTVTPSREVSYHFPLTKLYPNSLQITDFGFSPNFWADIKLVHPFPGSGIDVFDPRVIAILPTHWGAYFHYPSLGVYGNPKILLESDGYTKLFDELAPEIFGNVNPFVAYFKDVDYRRWSSIGQTEETKRWEMDLDAFGGALNFTLVLDVSTNYPDAPEPVIDNASEPVQIMAEIGDGLTEYGGSTDIVVTLIKWQGETTIGGVLVESPALFDGTIGFDFTSSGPNPNEYVYTGSISNDKFAVEGQYKCLIAAWDQVTGIHMYREFPVTVNTIPLSGDIMWAKRAGGTNFEYAYAVTSLSDDSAIITGYFMGSATFGQGEPNQTTVVSAGAQDFFIARYNSNGTLAWVKRVGGTNDDVGHGLTTLSDDSIVVTGYFYSSAVFGVGEANETTLHAATAWDHDMFIARYNPDGTLIWAKNAGGWNSDSGSAVTSLSDNSLVVLGYFRNESTFGKDEPNETTLYAEGDRDIFVAKYSSNGTFLWARRIGGSHEDIPRGITTLSDDSTVVTGHYHTSATFGENEPNETVLTSNGGFDIFIAKYNHDGALVWAKNAGGSRNEDEGHDITALSDDSVVVTGSFGGDATFGYGDPNETILTSGGSRDSFIARYNSDGSLLWAKRAGGSSSLNIAYGITTLSYDFIAITGQFYGSVTFGEGEPNETTLTSPGADEIFIARYKPNGTLAWAKHAGGTNWDNYAWDIASLSDDSTVVTGNISGIATFGTGETNQTILTSAGYTDVFIARFEP